MKNQKSSAKMRMIRAIAAVAGALLVGGAVPPGVAQSISLKGGQAGGQLQQLEQQAGGQPSLHSAGVAVEGIGSLVLLPGSLVALHVFEEPDLDGEYRMDEQGTIDMPIAGQISLNHMKLPEAEKAVGTKLISAGILKTAHVTVNVTEYSAQDVIILGEVRGPGKFPILAPRPLVEVLAMAGGETELAGTEVEIHRANQPETAVETVTYRRNIDEVTGRSVLVGPGDTVTVKRTGIVYVLGSVPRPGGYPMQESGALNVAQALALALGTSPDAATHSIRVLRKQPDGTILVFPVSYKKISKGTEVALPLRGEDIVFVPNSKLKDTFLNTKSVFSSATSAAIYVYR